MSFNNLIDKQLKFIINVRPAIDWRITLENDYGDTIVRVVKARTGTFAQDNGVTIS